MCNFVSPRSASFFFFNMCDIIIYVVWWWRNYLSKRSLFKLTCSWHDTFIRQEKIFLPMANDELNWTCSWKWASFWLFCGHLYCYIFINFLLTCKIEISYATSINKIDYLWENALFFKKEFTGKQKYTWETREQKKFAIEFGKNFVFDKFI